MLFKQPTKHEKLELPSEPDIYKFYLRATEIKIVQVEQLTSLGLTKKQEK